ncbi:zincin-like metallopeptidase domain-containing protein [Nitrosospira sp. NRS527]|uniref:ArdC family protein n=1 Tax=Nitrosospira sp. NRS527 TaxID=155925 RepID=UPI001AF3AD50|nr:zincin-like metallopeptidase domain-containing protein [Nitrosospira sp. NRS527]BCT67330.1 hypothetical protein NNRS527_00912 [Nitrosospira sp. NRS527]
MKSSLCWKAEKSEITWARTGNGLPRNHKTGAAYQGVNVLLLWASAMTHGYSSDRWLTYKQAADMRGQVRKGEKSVTCFFFKAIEREPRKGDAEKAESARIISPFWLFDLNQIDGIDKPRPQRGLTNFSRSMQPRALSGIQAQSSAEQCEKAFYRPSTDEIYLPERTRFASEIEFYGVALHELTHWTEAKYRLARDFGSRFGTESYAFEELIAELGNAFLNAELGFAESCRIYRIMAEGAEKQQTCNFHRSQPSQQSTPLYYGFSEKRPIRN